MVDEEGGENPYDDIGEMVGWRKQWDFQKIVLWIKTNLLSRKSTDIRHAVWKRKLAWIRNWQILKQKKKKR